MATLILGGLGLLSGNPIAAIAGVIAGKWIDKNFVAPAFGKNVQVEGPRLDDLKVMSSAEGAAVMRCYGRMRINTQLIWATHFHEIAHKDTQTTTKGGLAGTNTTTTTYTYQISLAIGLCEGPIVDIGKVWADGKEIDLSKFTWRLHKGDEAQGPDPKIEAVEGTGNVPAYRGLAYLVFEEMPLEQFGNRIPQITVEIIRRPNATGVRIEDILRGVTLIPGMGEFVYATDSIYRDDGFGGTIAENRHGAAGKSDLLVALDQLQSAAPNIAAVSLVVSWHGTDLRCGQCQIKPKVENAAKTTTPWSWQVSGVDRTGADVVSSDTFGPLLGGAPADRSIVQAITELKARGLRVVLYPLLMLDIPAGNSLPNPYSDNAATNGQAAFPWRGRITCSPAPGYVGTVDKTATASTQVDAFFGSAAPGDFGAWNGNTIPYSGLAEWSYRRMILHYAKLAVAAGGVDGFLIGSEMVALNAVRSSSSNFPAVSKMVTLAADVKGIVGSGCKVGYAANWDEYANYRPQDGSNDVYFHLDPLWSSTNIDFIGIDNYLPLSDWRSGTLHLDAQAGAPSIYDQGYLQGNIEGGELYNWYYASSANRTAQVRTNVTDGAYGEPWVFRYKDFKNWWINTHHNRPGGVRSGSATSWVAQSKPIWFTEFGCPAIDKGSNEPNVFTDPKSAESALPYFSTGRRDDLIQRSFVEALVSYWDPANGHNPTSSVYSAPMIDPASLFNWTWDARPYPQFPTNALIWRDGPNWRRGHWLSGRLGLVTLSDTVADITKNLGLTVDVSEINGIVRGFTIDSVMSPRDALAPLMQIYLVDVVESEGKVRFVQRGGPVAKTFTIDDLLDAASNGGDSDFYTLTRAQETDLPRTIHLQFLDPENNYQTADVYARRLKGSSQKITEIRPAIVLDFAEAQGIADTLLVDAWVMRESATLSLPPSSYALEPTDVIGLLLNGRTFTMRLDEIGYQHSRPAQLTRTDAATYGAADGASPSRPQPPGIEPGPAILQILDLPILVPTEVAGVPRFAAYAEPWSRVNVFRSPTTSGYELDRLLANRGTIGKTLFDFYSGPLWRWDRSGSLYVQIPSTQALASADEALVLGGANIGAIRNADGQWEILQFATAELIAANQYKLTNLLRGQLGSEYAMRDPVAAGAVFVLLDTSVLQSSATLALRGAALNWKWGPATKPIDDATYQSEAFTFNGIGLQPYASDHLRGTRNASTGDWTFTWIRRTRIGGDSWEGIDVPLGEDAELYDLEILNAPGTSVLRTVSSLTAPTFLYTAAMQTADFGATQWNVLINVYQVSPSYGRGRVAQKLTWNY